MGEIIDFGDLSKIFQLVKERKKNPEENNLYDFNAQEHFAVRGMPATLEECQEARREELNKIDEGGFMTLKQRKQINQTKTEVDDEIIENKERSKYTLKSAFQFSNPDKGPDSKKAEEKIKEKVEEEVEDTISPYWASPENILPSPESSVDNENRQDDAPVRSREMKKLQADSDSDSKIEIVFDKKKPKRDSYAARIDEIWRKECPITDPVPIIIDIGLSDRPICRPPVSKKEEPTKVLESYPADNNGNFFLNFFLVAGF